MGDLPSGEGSAIIQNMRDPQTKSPLTLADYPGEMVDVSCNRCGFEEQYMRATLLTVFKATTELKDILGGLAKCRRSHNSLDRCGARYRDLTLR
jgi:hypothetical protein